MNLTITHITNHVTIVQMVGVGDTDRPRLSNGTAGLSITSLRITRVSCLSFLNIDLCESP